MTSLKTLNFNKKEKLQQQIASEEEAISSLKEKLKRSGHCRSEC